MRAILTVFRKEMIDHLRDRRSVLIAMIYPLMGPVLLGMMFFFVGSSMRIHEHVAQVVPIVNAASAPALVRYLEKKGVTLDKRAGDVRSLVSSGQLPFALILPDRPAGPASPLAVRVLTNPARFSSIVATGQINGLLSDYRQQVLRERVRAAGLPATFTNIIDIEEENIGRAAGPAVILITMIPPFLIFTLFTGGVHVALDSTCGERERGSLEPLMINPVTRNQVLAGKLGAAIAFTLMALGLQVVAFWLMLQIVPRASLGLVAPPGALRLTLVAAACLPVAFLAAALQLLIAAATRSMKEAQTYLGLLPLIPGAAGMVLAMAPVNARPLLAVIPTFGQTVLMGQLVRDEFVSMGFVSITAIATLIATGLLLLLALRLYQREDMLFPQ